MTENIKATTRVDGKTVDREVGEAFKSYVLKKHGKIRGVFSDEVTKALATYLREAKSEKKREEQKEKVRSNIASWGGFLDERNNERRERVYLEVVEMLKSDGLIFRNAQGDVSVVDNQNATSIKAAIRAFLRVEKYFDVLCERNSLIVLDDDSVIETSSLKE